MAVPRAVERPPQLERRPEAKAFQLDELLHRVREGKLRIPPFQRGLKWVDGDRLALFDSIYRGYPIGTLLFWQREASAGRLSLGKLSLDAPARSDALWVVDGQQRITTLAETLLGPEHPDERSIHFELQDEKFVYARTRPEPEPGELPKLPLSVVLDSTVLLEWLFAHPGIGAAPRALVVEVGKRIREYQVPSYIVEASTDGVLRTIFHRTNRAGRRLEEEEVFNALFGSLSADQPSDLRQLAQRSSELDFGRLAESDVLNALLAVRGIPLDRDFAEALTRDEVPEALRAADAALRETIVFLRRDAGIVHAELLPYALPIVVLSKFFHVFPTPRDRSRLLLRRWLWRGALGGRLTGATIEMRQHLACIDDKHKDEERSVQRLLELAGTTPPEDVLRLDRFQFSTARTKLQCCAMASLAPRHLITGEPLDLPALLSPRAEEKVTILLRGKLAADERAHGLANRLLHPRIPSPELVKAISTSTDERTLTSHAIPREAQRALSARDGARFLALRERALRDVVDRYFRSQAEWGADDSPSLESMIVSEG
jgi:hypothetical protein